MRVLSVFIEFTRTKGTKVSVNVLEIIAVEGRMVNEDFFGRGQKCCEVSVNRFRYIVFETYDEVNQKIKEALDKLPSEVIATKYNGQYKQSTTQIYESKRSEYSFLSEVKRAVEMSKQSDISDGEFQKQFEGMNILNFRNVVFSLVNEANLPMGVFADRVGSSEAELNRLLKNGEVSKDLHDTILDYFDIEKEATLWSRYIFE